MRSCQKEFTRATSLSLIAEADSCSLFPPASSKKNNQTGSTRDDRGSSSLHSNCFQFENVVMKLPEKKSQWMRNHLVFKDSRSISSFSVIYQIFPSKRETRG